MLKVKFQLDLKWIIKEIKNRIIFQNNEQKSNKIGINLEKNLSENFEKYIDVKI